MKVSATYVSVWDGGIEVRTACQYDPDTKTVTDIEDSDVEGVENLDDEYVEVDGHQLRDDDGVTFDY